MPRSVSVSSALVASSRIEDRRVLEQRARDPHPLLLAARELQPALADGGGVALRQPDDEVVDLRRPRRRLHLLAASPPGRP